MSTRLYVCVCVYMGVCAYVVFARGLAHLGRSVEEGKRKVGREACMSVCICGLG